MRAWTLGLSIAVHLGFICAVVVAPLFATDDLPVPPRITEFVRVVAAMPEPPRAPEPPRVAPPSPDAAPLQPPETIAPEVVREPQPPADVDFTAPGEVNTAGSGILPGAVPVTDFLPPPPPVAPPPPPIRVGGVIKEPKKIRDVAPRYPVVAQQAKIEGLVILEAVISEDGDVQSVRVLRSKPLLDAAAVDAVRQWRFTPTLLNGQPVPVVMTVTVNFSLN